MSSQPSSRFFLLLFLLLAILIPDGRTQNQLEPVRFSHQAGFYAGAFSLQLTHPDADAIILYTTDGSTPTHDRLNGEVFTFKRVYPRDPDQPFGEPETQEFRTFTYSSPILVVNRNQEADLYTHITTQPRPTPFQPGAPQPKATVIRARAFIPPDRYSETVTRTYFIGERIHELPVISINVDPSRFFDYEEGIYVPGADFDTWRQNNPTLTYNDGRPGNYSARGEETEVEGSFEFFETDGRQAVNQTVGLRMHGAWSRSFPMKSLRVYSRSEYGVSRLNHRFFTDSDHNRFNRLILRHSGQDFYSTLFRDAAIQTMVRHLNIETQAYRPTVHYVNGEFWGIINVRERFDKHYLEQHFGVDPDNIDLLTFRSVVKEGDNLHYEAMLRYARNHPADSPEFLEEMSRRMDIRNFIDYQLANIYAANTDWPGNNIDFWRLRTDGYVADAPHGHDGRWRWMLYDTDFGFNRYHPFAIHHNTLELATEAGNDDWPNPDWSTFLLRTLLGNPDFRNAFITRFSDQLNTALLPSRTGGIIQEMKSAIEPEIYMHLSRWQTHDRAAWDQFIGWMLTFAEHRPENQRTHLKDFFELGEPIIVTVATDVENGSGASSHPLTGGYIRINTIDLHPATPGVSEMPYPWSGSYFPGIPLRAEAIALPGYRFTGWAGSSDSPSRVISLLPDDDVTLTASFEPVREAPDEPIVLYGWDFNALPSGELSRIHADFGRYTDGVLHYAGTGSGYMDRVSPGTTVMAAEDETPAGFALRVRNPSGDRALRMEVPAAKDYESLVLNYAVSRTANGAQWHQLWVRANDHEAWKLAGEPVLVPFIEGVYLGIQMELADSLIADSEYLELEFRFGGSNSTGTSGNTRFDNLYLSGLPVTPVSAALPEQPREFVLEQNFPNPFNATTQIRYELQQAGQVRLEVLDMLGRRVAVWIDAWQDAGRHQITVDASSLASGVYLYRLSAPEGVYTRKMTLLK